MTDINAPKGDRAGGDYRQGPNPQPGGEVDPGMVPPYDDRNDGRNERSGGPERMLSGEAPPQQPPGSREDQPQSSAEPREGAGMAPEGVGESHSRGGEQVVTQEGKEPGRYDSGTDGTEADRPTGGSTPRDLAGTHPQEGPE